MTLLVTSPFKSVKEACEQLKVFGVLVDYDKNSDLKIKEKIILGKVHKIFPIYRRNENCLSEGDCLSLLMQKAFPVESFLSEKPRIFRLLCAGDVIMKLSHIQVNTFIAVKNPKFFRMYDTQEPTFTIDKSVKIIWEFPNLIFSDRPQKTSLTNGCEKLPPLANKNNVADNEDLPRLNGDKSFSIDVGECVSHRSDSPTDLNEKEESEIEEVNHYVRARTCHENLELSPIEPQKERCRSNIRQRYENLNAAEDTSSESSYGSKNSKPMKGNLKSISTKSNTKVNTGSCNINNNFHQLCSNARSKNGQHFDNTCAGHQCCNPCQENNTEGDRIFCYLVDSAYLNGCTACQATGIDNYRVIHNSAAVNGTCQIHSSKILLDQAIVPVRSVHYRKSPNNCNNNVHLNGPKEYNKCSITNHCSCENRNSTPLHKMHMSNSMSPERDCIIHKLGRRNGASPEPGPSKRKNNCSMSPERCCIKNKLYRDKSMSPRKSPKQGHNNNKYDGRNGASPEPGPSKHKLGKTNSRPPERCHLNSKKRKLYDSGPDLSEYKRNRNNSVSPVRGKDKLGRDNSKSPERSPPTNKSDRNNSKSPERDHPNNKKKLYNTDQNLSDLLIGNFSPIGSVSSQTEKQRCNLGKQREESSKTEKIRIEPFNKSEANTVQKNKKQMQTSSAVENCSKGSDSSPRKQHEVHLNSVETSKDLISEDEQQLSDDLKQLENNFASVQGTSSSPLDNSMDGDETINPSAIEANLTNKITETDCNSVVFNGDVFKQRIEKPNENLIEMKEINSLEERNNKSDTNEKPVSDGSGMNSATQDLHETNTVNEEIQPSEVMSQPYYDAEEGNIDSQVAECLNIIKTLSVQSFNSFKQLFSTESDDFREDVLLTLRSLRKKVQISAVVVDMCPDIRMDPLSIVKATCLSGCRQSFYINTVANKVMKNPKCKCCRLVTHFVCPTCSQQYGKPSPMCLSFCFGLDVLYGQNVLSIAVTGSSAERFLGCTLSNYLAYSSVSSYIVSIMKKIIINRPPEDWSNVILLKFNVKSIGLSTGQIIFKLVNTYLGDSLIRRGCFISVEQL